MKLSKRIAAGFLAAAMMATMAFPAFADSTVKNYYATGSEGALVDKDVAGTKGYSISKTYNAPTGWKFGAETLSLAVTKNPVAGSAQQADYPSNDPSFSSITINSGDTTVNNSFNLTLPEYSKIGKYVYKITENSGENHSTAQTGATYVTSDTTNARTFYMQVQVTAHEETVGSETNVVPSAYDVRVRFSSTTDFTANGQKKINTVTNEIKDNSTPPEEGGDYGLDITKKVKGSSANPDAVYKFTVAFEKADGAGALNTQNIKTTIAADSTATATVNNGTVTIEMKANDTVKITGVPLGAKYTITETETNSATSTAFSGSVTSTTTSATGTITSSDNVTVTNTFGNAEIDTGVILDNAPYIVMIAVVAAAAVVFVISKKRREE